MSNYENKRLRDLCRDQSCYLRLDGCVGGPTVPCHSNQQRHGRGFSFKSHDLFTLPGCNACHYELDYGKNLSREEKQDAFQRGWEQWQLDLHRSGRLKVA